MGTSTPAVPLTIPRGSSRKFRVRVTQNGTAFDLTGCKIWFAVRLRIEDPGYVLRKRNTLAGGSDAEILLELQVGADAKPGQFLVLFVPADTANANTCPQYIADIWIERPTNPIERIQVLAPTVFKVTAAIERTF